MTIETQDHYEKSNLSRQPSVTMEVIRADMVSLRRGFYELLALSREGLKASNRTARELWRNRRETLAQLVQSARAPRRAVKPRVSSDGNS